MTNAEYIAYMRANPQEWGKLAKDRCTGSGATITVLHKDEPISIRYIPGRQRVYEHIASKLQQYRNPCIVVRHDRVG